MPTCKISKEMQIKGITPISNIFLCEYMPNAKGDYVKVYLYALMQCYLSLNCDIVSLAHDLSIEEQEVFNALDFWVRRGVVKKCGMSFEFCALEDVLSIEQSNYQHLSKYNTLISSITQVLGGRVLKPEHAEKVYDWVEMLGMEEDCIIIMVDYAINIKYKKGSKISFISLDKLAFSWAEKNIKTAKQAIDYIQTIEVVNSDAKQILRHLGQLRNPTKDEYDLLKKWKFDYGFELDAIINCCAQMTYSKNPSFALLDKIICGYKEKNIISKSDIEQEKQQSDDRHNFYREIYTRCGGYGNITPGKKAIIDNLLNEGFNRQGLLYICDYCEKYYKTGIASVEKVANELKIKNIIEENDVASELENRVDISNKCNEFYENAGFKRSISSKDIDFYKYYLSIFNSHEILLAAAKFASVANNKANHLSLLLNTWKDQGINNIKDVYNITAEPKKITKNPGYMRSETKVRDEDQFDN